MLSVFLLATSLGLAGCQQPAKPAAACRPTPSGFPVPRFVSLKHDPANARGGPGDDYRLLWIYHHKGLPLMVVEETAEWRRVRDPEGQRSWVHKRVLDGARTVMRTEASDLSLRDRPAADARVTAVLSSHAIAILGKCRGDWCQVSADHAAGWARRDSLWGAIDPSSTEGCREP
jgi:SH3-like domain-containing protein